MNVPQIKICGLTRLEEAGYLNEVKADYAGFVFYRKSKRNVTMDQARLVHTGLSENIKCVAVTVSPDVRLCQQIEEAGFDILQVHGELKPEVLIQSQIPIWRACNIKDIKELEQLEQHEKIVAYLVDASDYGSGRTFDWQSCQDIKEKKEHYFKGKTFVLAGGLNSENVAEGVQTFEPDIVDVSSGVEKDGRKDRQLIADFVRSARGAVQV